MARTPKRTWSTHEIVARWTPDRIRLLRLHMGMTQEELAKELETDAKNVCDWETGKHVPFRPRMREIQHLAEKSGFWKTIAPKEPEVEDDE